eukprot:TRINITY_DN2331_c0_g1_i4.p1 TRINITY_DN2331_c0_g1~~TRINITY_DN2331_c0_g1_i4.p1  ORF type:complete len:1787 (+),score=428.30 TRINITY_DN2331_c0_g1_i4:45-5405(+)
MPATMKNQAVYQAQILVDNARALMDGINIKRRNKRDRSSKKDIVTQTSEVEKILARVKTLRIDDNLRDQLEDCEFELIRLRDGKTKFQEAIVKAIQDKPTDILPHLKLCELWLKSKDIMALRSKISQHMDTYHTIFQKDFRWWQYYEELLLKMHSFADEAAIQEILERLLFCWHIMIDLSISEGANERAIHVLDTLCSNMQTIQNDMENSTSASVQELKSYLKEFEYFILEHIGRLILKTRSDGNADCEKSDPPGTWTTACAFSFLFRAFAAPCEVIRPTYSHQLEFSELSLGAISQSRKSSAGKLTILLLEKNPWLNTQDFRVLGSNILPLSGHKFPKLESIIVQYYYPIDPPFQSTRDMSNMSSQSDQIIISDYFPYDLAKAISLAQFYFSRDLANVVSTWISTKFHQVDVISEPLYTQLGKPIQVDLVIFFLKLVIRRHLFPNSQETHVEKSTWTGILSHLPNPPMGKVPSGKMVPSIINRCINQLRSGEEEDVQTLSIAAEYIQTLPQTKKRDRYLTNFYMSITDQITSAPASDGISDPFPGSFFPRTVSSETTEKANLHLAEACIRCGQTDRAIQYLRSVSSLSSLFHLLDCYLVQLEKFKADPKINRRKLEEIYLRPAFQCWEQCYQKLSEKNPGGVIESHADPSDPDVFKLNDIKTRLNSAKFQLQKRAVPGTPGMSPPVFNTSPRKSNTPASTPTKSSVPKFDINGGSPRILQEISDINQQLEKIKTSPSPASPYRPPNTNKTGSDTSPLSKPPPAFPVSAGFSFAAPVDNPFNNAKTTPVENPFNNAKSTVPEKVVEKPAVKAFDFGAPAVMPEVSTMAGFPPAPSPVAKAEPIQVVDSKPAFNFGSSNAVDASSTFASSASSTAKPVLNFGGAPSSTSVTPGGSGLTPIGSMFGGSSTGASAPSFSFSTASTIFPSNPTPATFSPFPANPSPFSFGTPAKSSTAPVITAETKPTPSPIVIPEKPIIAAPSLAGSSPTPITPVATAPATSSTAAPTFNFSSSASPFNVSTPSTTSSAESKPSVFSFTPPAPSPAKTSSTPPEATKPGVPVGSTSSPTPAFTFTPSTSTPASSSAAQSKTSAPSTPPAKSNAPVKLYVKVIGAKGLAPSDNNGSSDPYVEITVGKQKYKTKVVDKNLNPVWNETFTFENVKDVNLVEFSVMDKDNIFSANDPLGTLTLHPREDHASTQGSFKLNKPDKYQPPKGVTMPTSFGEIQLEITWSDAPLSTPSSPSVTATPKPAPPLQDDEDEEIDLQVEKSKESTVKSGKPAPQPSTSTQGATEEKKESAPVTKTVFGASQPVVSFSELAKSSSKTTTTSGNGVAEAEKAKSTVASQPGAFSFGQSSFAFGSSSGANLDNPLKGGLPQSSPAQSDPAPPASNFSFGPSAFSFSATAAQKIDFSAASSSAKGGPQKGASIFSLNLPTETNTSTTETVSSPSDKEKTKHTESKQEDKKGETEKGGFFIGGEAPKTSYFDNVTTGKSVFGSTPNSGTPFSFSAPPSTTSAPSQASTGFTFSPSATSTPAQGWKCLACEVMNSDDVTNCDTCFTKKPGPDGKLAPLAKRAQIDLPVSEEFAPGADDDDDGSDSEISLDETDDEEEDTVKTTKPEEKKEGGFFVGGEAPKTSYFDNVTTGKSVFGSTSNSASSFSFGSLSSAIDSSEKDTPQPQPTSGFFFGAPTQSKPAQGWKCLACEAMNSDDVTNCDTCFTKKPGPDGKLAPLAKRAIRFWINFIYNEQPIYILSSFDRNFNHFNTRCNGRKERECSCHKDSLWCISACCVFL